MVETKLPTHYILAKNIVDLSVWKYNKTRRGITFEDLLTKGLAKHKRQAQDCLKYHLRKGNIFAPSKRRPQEYFATCIKSKITEKMAATSTPMDPTGIASSKSMHPLANCIEPLIPQTLEGYVLPLLPRAPMYLHNLHFKLTITPQCYRELDLPGRGGNKHGKYLDEIIGTTAVTYVFYSGGTIDVYAKCSNRPFRLENELDRSNIVAFLGQMRDRLITFLMDRHERIVPHVMDWRLTECDVNKDIKVSHLLHFTGIKIQVKHLDHLFKVYVKPMGENAVCRVDETKSFEKKNPIEVIDELYNPNQVLANRIEILHKKVDTLSEVLAKLTARLEDYNPLKTESVRLQKDT